MKTFIVQRYSNRKLYSKDLSRYVTAEKIMDLIRSGNKVKVFDHTTSEDVTRKVLSGAVVKTYLKDKEESELVEIVKQYHKPVKVTKVVYSGTE